MQIKQIEAYLKGNHLTIIRKYTVPHTNNGHSDGEHHCGEEKHGCSGNGENQ